MDREELNKHAVNTYIGIKLYVLFNKVFQFTFLISAVIFAVIRKDVWILIGGLGLFIFMAISMFMLGVILKAMHRLILEYVGISIEEIEAEEDD